MLCWNQPPGKAGPQTSPHAHHHPFSKPATVLKTETLIQIPLWHRVSWDFFCSLCALRLLLVAGYETYHSETLWEKCRRWNLTLDPWTLGQVLLSSSTGLKERLQCHIFLMAKLDSLMHVHTNAARTNAKALDWFSCPSLQKTSSTEASSAARFSSCQIECDAI